MTEAIGEVEEKLQKSPPIQVIFQRHGEFDRASGNITDKGVGETRSIAQKRVGEILSSTDRPVTFFILNSPSAWFGAGTIPLGRRAEDTAIIVAEEIQNSIKEQGGQLELHRFGKSLKGTRPHEKLEEPNYYFVEGADNPEAYFEALVEKYGPEEREEGWHEVPADLEEVREKTGAESSLDVANRLGYLARVINRYAKIYLREHPDRNLVFWLVTHGDVIRSFLQHGMGIEGETAGYSPDLSEALSLSLKNGKLSTSFKGKDYNIKL